VNVFQARGLIRAVVGGLSAAGRAAKEFGENVPETVSNAGSVLLSELIADRLSAMTGATVEGSPTMFNATQNVQAARDALRSMVPM
jgi:hypothetical protein